MFTSTSASTDSTRGHGPSHPDWNRLHQLRVAPSAHEQRDACKHLWAATKNGSLVSAGRRSEVSTGATTGRSRGAQAPGRYANELTSRSQARGACGGPSDGAEGVRNVTHAAPLAETGELRFG